MPSRPQYLAACRCRCPNTGRLPQGAAVPEVWLTAFVNLFLEGNCRQAKRRSFTPEQVVSAQQRFSWQSSRRNRLCTAGANTNLDRCRELGADLAITKGQDFRPKSSRCRQTASMSFSIPLVAVSGAQCRSVAASAESSTSGYSAALRHKSIWPIVLRKRLTIIGSTLRTRALAEKSQSQNNLPAAWEQLLSGELQIVIDSQFPVEQAQQAHDYVAQNHQYRQSCFNCCVTSQEMAGHSSAARL